MLNAHSVFHTRRVVYVGERDGGRSEMVVPVVTVVPAARGVPAAPAAPAASGRPRPALRARLD
jgi:hypothetical protein